MKNPHTMTMPELIEATKAFQDELRQRLQDGLQQLSDRTASLQRVAAEFGVGDARALTGKSRGHLALAGPAKQGAKDFRNTPSYRLKPGATGQVGKATKPKRSEPSEAFKRGVPGATYGGIKLTLNGPRFANPADKEQTWTGIGKKPMWMVETLKTQSLESMIIPGSKPPMRRGGAAKRLADVNREFIPGHQQRRGSGTPSSAPVKRAPALSETAPLFSNPFKPSERWNGHGKRPEWFGLARRNGYTIEQLNMGGPIPKAMLTAFKTPGATFKGPAALERAMAAVAETMTTSGGPGMQRFRNPADPDQTWHGGGTQPSWMRELIEKGRSPEEFLITGATMPNRKDFERFAQH